LGCCWVLAAPLTTSYVARAQTNHGEIGVAKKRKKQTTRKKKKQTLAGMDFEGLMDLRNEVEDALSGYRGTLEKQLAALGSSVASVGGRIARGGRRSLKGMKVAPKYRDSSGNTWAGRGATPRWLKAAIKEGKNLEDFAIDKTVGKAAKKARKKRKSKG
jgi:DNA-binding protein H-NS